MNKKQEQLNKEIELDLPDVSSDEDLEQVDFDDANFENNLNYNLLNRTVPDSRKRITFESQSQSHSLASSYQTNLNFSRGNTKVSLKSVDLIREYYVLFLRLFN